MIQVGRAVSQKFVLFKFIATLALVILCPNSSALDFNRDGDQLIMSGEIRQGDLDRLIYYLRDNLNLFIVGEVVMLNSPGGNVEEAIKLAEFVHRTNRSTIVPSGAECSSACFYLLVAGGTRGTVSGKIGIHRPYYMPERFKTFTPSQARMAYERLDDRVRQYLTKMRVPDEVIRLMFATPSSSMEYLSPLEFSRLMGTYQPWYEELQSSACPNMSRTLEAECMKWIGAIDRASMVEEFFGAEISLKKKQEISAVRALGMQKLQKLRGSEQKYAEASKELREAAVEKVHPQWKMLVRSSVFSAWLKNQPPSLRKLAASDDPEDAVFLITIYKEALVENVHPNWKALVSSSVFTSWLKNQPANMRRLAASNESDDAVMLITAFKNAQGR